MNEMPLYPMKFTPILKEKLWGGIRIPFFYRHDLRHEGNVGESWELCDIADDSESVVENGFLAENTLGELVEVYMGDLVGDAVYDRYGRKFPLLVKLIDAAQPLSIQVHPDAAMACEEHGDGSCGKNEMWYVLNAEPDSYLLVGFDHYVGEGELREALRGNDLERLCRKVPVKAGDVFYMPAGTVHSIGRGCTIVEVQNASDITYRLYDYDRKDADGNRRELHTDLALRAINYDGWHVEPVEYALAENEPVRLVECEDFVANLMRLTKPQEYELGLIQSFVVLVCVEGHVTVQYEDDYLTMVQGETLLVPAEMTSLVLAPAGEAKLVEVYVR